MRSSLVSVAGQKGPLCWEGSACDHIESELEEMLMGVPSFWGFEGGVVAMIEGISCGLNCFL